MLEIERKFLYSGSMNDSTFEKAEVCLLIIQWYLSPPDTRRLRLAVSPGLQNDRNREDRVRNGQRGERTEISIEILHEMAYRLKCEKAVVKARYVYPRRVSKV